LKRNNEGQLGDELKYVRWAGEYEKLEKDYSDLRNLDVILLLKKPCKSNQHNKPNYFVPNNFAHFASYLSNHFALNYFDIIH
jgi:hypothetical protein